MPLWRFAVLLLPWCVTQTGAMRLGPSRQVDKAHISHKLGQKSAATTGTSLVDGTGVTTQASKDVAKVSEADTEAKADDQGSTAVTSNSSDGKWKDILLVCLLLLSLALLSTVISVLYVRSKTEKTVTQSKSVTWQEDDAELVTEYHEEAREKFIDSFLVEDEEGTKHESSDNHDTQDDQEDTDEPEPEIGWKDKSELVASSDSDSDHDKMTMTKAVTMHDSGHRRLLKRQGCQKLWDPIFSESSEDEEATGLLDDEDDNYVYTQSRTAKAMRPKRTDPTDKDGRPAVTRSYTQ